MTARLDLGAEDVPVPVAGDLCEGPQWNARSQRLGLPRATFAG